MCSALYCVSWGSDVSTNRHERRPDKKVKGFDGLSGRRVAVSKAELVVYVDVCDSCKAFGAMLSETLDRSALDSPQRPKIIALRSFNLSLGRCRVILGFLASFDQSGPPQRRETAVLGGAMHLSYITLPLFCTHQCAVWSLVCLCTVLQPPDPLLPAFCRLPAARTYSAPAPALLLSRSGLVTSTRASCQPTGRSCCQCSSSAWLTRAR